MRGGAAFGARHESGFARPTAWVAVHDGSAGVRRAIASRRRWLRHACVERDRPVAVASNTGLGRGYEIPPCIGLGPMTVRPCIHPARA